jgi:RES domain-containing protein
MLQPNPLYTFFTEQLSKTTTKGWRGIGFRSVVPRYANSRDMISGVGAFRGGGRWNPPGVHAVYASLEPGLSVDEAMGVVFSDRGFSVSDVRPRVVAGVRCQLDAVIDLSSDSTVTPWLKLDELLSEDWNTANANSHESSSQAFGRAVSEVSEALLVPSARRVGNNLIIYPKSLRASSILEIEHQEELPPK